MLLRRYLETRFGVIPSELEGRMAASGADALTALFESALAATDVEAI